MTNGYKALYCYVRINSPLRTDNNQNIFRHKNYIIHYRRRFVVLVIVVKESNFKATCLLRVVIYLRVVI